MQNDPYGRGTGDTTRQTRRPVQDDTSMVRPPVGRSSRSQNRTYPSGGTTRQPTQNPYQPQSSVPYGQTVNQPYAPQGYQNGQMPPNPTNGTYQVPQQSAPVPPYQQQASQGYTGYQQEPSWQAQPSAPYVPQNTGGGMPMQPSAPYVPPQEDTSAYRAEADPFGEPGVDPELKKQRSKNLIKKKGDFWEATPEEKAKHAKQTARAVAIAVLILCAACAVLYYGVLRVRTIQVVGNSQVSSETVVNLSGISLGDSTLRIDTDAAKKQINSNRYLVFRSIDCELLGTVTIRVKEREAAAVMNYCGINYTIDNKGMVLEESEDVAATSDLPLISGMDISGQFGCVVGRVITVANSAQLVAMKEILVELKVLKAEGKVTKIKMSDLSHILLETSDGYSVSLGSNSNIHAKLKSMLAIQDKLNSMESGTGTIDVSDPESPTFLPETE